MALKYASVITLQTSYGKKDKPGGCFIHADRKTREETLTFLTEHEHFEHRTTTNGRRPEARRLLNRRMKSSKNRSFVNLPGSQGLTRQVFRMQSSNSLCPADFKAWGLLTINESMKSAL